MSIYEFTVTQTILVEAESVDQAVQVAEDSVPDLDWPNYHVEFEQEIFSLNDLNEMEWDRNCIPYGGDGNTRLKDLLPETSEELS